MREEKSEANSHTACAYARVSTAEQAAGMSLDAQLGAIRAYARQRGLTIATEFVERGATGTDDLRPEFQRMIEVLLSPANQVDVVLVLHTSRFMRDVELARRYKRELRRHGVRVVAIQQEVADDANGELMEGIYEIFDQHESRIIGARTRAAMKENARQGFFNGTAPPFGFRVERCTSPTGKEKRRLVPDEGESTLVREVFALYVRGRGAKAVARELNQREQLYRGAHWSRDLVLQVIEDTSAIGTYTWGRKDSHTGRLRPESEHVRVALPAIVDEAVFAEALRVRARRDPKRREARDVRTTQLLGGLLRCGKCGQGYQLETSGKLDPQGKPTHRYYNCRGYCRSGREACAGYRIRTDLLDRAVLDHLAGELFSEARCRELLRVTIDAQAGDRERAAGQRHGLEAQRADLDQRIERWCTAFEAGGDLAELGADRLRGLRERRAEVERELAQVEQAAPPPLPPYLFKPAVVARFQSALRTAFEGGDRDVARAYLDRLVGRIVLTDGDVVVEGKAEGAVALMAETRGTAQGNPPLSTAATKVRTYVVGWRAT